MTLTGQLFTRVLRKHPLRKVLTFLQLSQSLRHETRPVQLTLEFLDTFLNTFLNSWVVASRAPKQPLMPTFQRSADES